jgi:hypothetical protein
MRDLTTQEQNATPQPLSLAERAAAGKALTEMAYEEHWNANEKTDYLLGSSC